MANPRVRKIADRIQVIVAEMLERRIKDPRLGFVTITDVRVTGDSQQATIFYTVLAGAAGEQSDEKALADTAAALESAKGLIRSEVAKQLGMRHRADADVRRRRAAGVGPPPRRGARARPQARRGGRGAPGRGVRRRARPVQEAPRGRGGRRGRPTRTPTWTPTRTPTRVTTESGLVVVDKPAGITSHDVVARVRRLAGTRKVGPRRHPRPDGDRRAGRRCRAGHPAARAPDADREGVRRHGPPRCRDRHRRRRGRGHRDRLGRAPATRPRSGPRFAEQVGELVQVPTAVSAVKVDGVRAYQRVRDGEEVALEPRRVTVHELTVTDVRRSRRARAAWSTSTSRCAAPAAPTCAPSPGTSAPRSGSAGTSPRCGVPRSGPTASTSRTPSTSSAEAFTVLPIADAARAAFPARDLDEATAAVGAVRPGARRPPRRADRAVRARTASSWRSTSRATARPAPSRSSSEPLGSARADLAIPRRGAGRPGPHRRGDRQLRRRPPRAPARPGPGPRDRRPGRAGRGRGDLRPAPDGGAPPGARARAADLRRGACRAARRGRGRPRAGGAVRPRHGRLEPGAVRRAGARRHPARRRRGRRRQLPVRQPRRR